MQTRTALSGMAPDITVLPPLALPSVADEVDHRVANHLQLISALISIEARQVADTATLAILERTRGRIAAIAGVHRQLYSRGTAEVDLGSYLEELGKQLSRCCAPHRNVTVDADTVPVGSTVAASVGILATELVTNACKHAYAAEEPGDVRITLRRLASGAHRLAVEDRGSGGEPESAGTGLGSHLIEATVARLGGVSAWEDARPGIRFRMDVRF